MKIPIECVGCANFIRAHIGGYWPYWEYFPAKCAIHAKFKEDCKDQEYHKDEQKEHTK